jgi:hypothetical protein
MVIASTLLAMLVEGELGLIVRISIFPGVSEPVELNNLTTAGYAIRRLFDKLNIEPQEGQVPCLATLGGTLLQDDDVVSQFVEEGGTLILANRGN